jgi:hypothetical protein
MSLLPPSDLAIRLGRMCFRKVVAIKSFGTVSPHILTSKPKSIIDCSYRYQRFNLLEKHGQIGAREAYIWGRNTVVFDVGWYVLLMGEGRC